MIAERTRFSFSAVTRSGSVCRLVPARDLNAAFFQEEAREMGVKKAKRARLLSLPSGALRRIGAVAYEERSGPKFG
jgi:hypothetical protein